MRSALFVGVLLMAGCINPDPPFPSAPTPVFSTQTPDVSPAPSPSLTAVPEETATPRSPPEETPPVAATPTPEAPTPEAVAAPTPEPPTPAVRAAPDLAHVTFDVQGNVSNASLDAIRDGMARAQRYIFEQTGDMSPTNGTSMRVLVVATGQGNQEAGGGGACCTATSEDAPTGQPFFDVLHRDWLANQYQDWAHEKIAAHEFAHTWQAQIGCLGYHDASMGDWLNEGIAEYVGLHTIATDGLADNATVDRIALNAALSSGELDVPLRDLVGPGGHVWAGDAGYLAVTQLVANATRGVAALQDVCAYKAAGAPLDQAFERAFGVRMADFYASFDSWRQAALAQRSR